jgi:hypothetical protein
VDRLPRELFDICPSRLRDHRAYCLCISTTFLLRNDVRCKPSQLSKRNQPGGGVRLRTSFACISVLTSIHFQYFNCSTSSRHQQVLAGVSRDYPLDHDRASSSAPSPLLPQPLPFCITFLRGSGRLHEYALFHRLLRGCRSSDDRGRLCL